MSNFNFSHALIDIQKVILWKYLIIWYIFFNTSKYKIIKIGILKDIFIDWWSSLQCSWTCSVGEETEKHKVYNMMIMSVIDVRQRKIRYIEKTDRVVFSVMKVNIIISTCPSQINWLFLLLILIIFFFFLHRVFTFGMGDGCSTELIRDVAKAGNGKATFVKDSDRLQSKVIKSLLCILYNVMTSRAGFA